MKLREYVVLFSAHPRKLLEYVVLFSAHFRKLLEYVVLFSAHSRKLVIELTFLLPMNDVEDTIGQAGVLGELGQHHASSWVLLAGLDDVGVAHHRCQGKHLRGRQSQ